MRGIEIPLFSVSEEGEEDDDDERGDANVEEGKMRRDWRRRKVKNRDEGILIFLI